MARKYDSEETKQKILSSSVRLFIEKGYHETTMTEILQIQLRLSLPISKK